MRVLCTPVTAPIAASLEEDLMTDTNATMADNASLDPETAHVQEIVSEQDALVAGFYSFEEMIWKRINEQEDDDRRTAVATWISAELDRVQTVVTAVANHQK